MRIVGGKFRGRALATPPSMAIRPSSDRLRENLFNILQHRFDGCLDQARVLDLFAGTGALGLEALSRGAAHVLFVDNEATARGLVRENIERCQQVGTARIFRRDATALGPLGTGESYSLVFCDPPYGRHLGEKALSAAADGGWLADQAVCIIEEEKTATVTLPGEFDHQDHRHIAGSALHFYRYRPAQLATD